MIENKIAKDIFDDQGESENPNSLLRAESLIKGEEPMSIFSGNSETAWSIYHKLIKDAVGGDDPPVVIMPLGIAQRVEWDTPYDKWNLFLKQNIANAMPEWGSLYNRSAGRDVGQEYEALLDRLSVKFIEQGNVDVARKKQLDDARKAARENMRTLERTILTDWNAYCQGTPASDRIPRNRWEQEMGYTADRASYQQELQIAEGAYFLEVNNAGGRLAEVGRAIAALGAREAKIALPSSQETIGNESLWESYFQTNVLGDINQFKAERIEHTFTLNESQHQSTTYTTKWGGSASFQFFYFFGAGGSTDNERIQKSWEDDTTEVKITFGNLNVFQINRGQWFRGGLIREYLNDLEPEFWGARGRLNLIPTGLVVAHSVEVDITTSSENGSYAYERHQHSGSAGFRCGPFRFGGSGGYTSTYESTTVVKTETGLKVKDTSGRALVLAVICERPADLLAAGHPVTPFFMVRNRPSSTSKKASTRDLSEEDKAKYISYWHEAIKKASKQRVQSVLK